MRLSDYLEQADVTAAEFARRIGVTRQAVGRYARGERFPERDVLQRILAATDGAVTPNDFFEEGAAA